MVIVVLWFRPGIHGKRLINYKAWRWFLFCVVGMEWNHEDDRLIIFGIGQNETKISTVYF